jgi:uncharacterized protein (DUF58 family)
LGRFGLLAVLAGLVLAAWNSQLVIVIVLGLVLSTAGLTKLWSRYSLLGVSCQRVLDQRRAFPGEYIELKLRLANRKLLPLPWIQVDDEIPVGFAPDISLTEGKRHGFGLLSKNAALLWYTGISWRHRLYCHKRGYYRLGPITITSGDIFGFYPRSVAGPAAEHVIVYPRIFPISQLGIPSLYPLGETVAERRIFEDPTRVAGVREYMPHDSLRRIHWKATARRNALQVKVYEPSTTLKVAIFLAVDSFHNRDASDEDDFELGISTAASIAERITRQSSQVGLYINTRLADTGQPARIPPGSGSYQLVGILEALAKVTPHFSGDFAQFLQRERRGLPWGTSLIVILSQPSESLARVFASLKNSGQKLLVLQVGSQDRAGIDGAIGWHNVMTPENLINISTVEEP